MHTRATARFPLLWGILSIVSLLGLLWIALDRAPFGGDQSHYATEAVNLFRTLRESPSLWPSAMSRAIGFKAPGIVWIGQFFVPIGALLGSVDAGLLLLIALVHLLAVLLTYHSLRALADDDARVPVLGSLVVASAPLSVHLSHEFLVETLQMLATAYFLLVATFAPRWNRGRVLAHLLLATAVAVLAKASSPLFCFGPGLLALGWALAPGRPPRGWAWLRASTLVPLASGLLLALAAAGWYVRNLDPVRRHVAFSSAGPFALYWGKEDTFLNSLLYWLGVLGTELFLPPVALLGTGALVAAVTLFVARRQRQAAHFTACAAAAALEVVVVLAAFSLATSRVTRYLLPALPYCALLLAWAVARLGSRAVTWTAIVVFTLQFALVQGQAFGLIRSPYLRSVRPIDTSGRSRDILDGVVDRTCGSADAHPYLVIIGIDPSLRGDWLAPVPATYVSAKRNLRRGTTPPCYYDYLGGSFFGGSPSRAWSDLSSRRARYLVTVDPRVYPAPPKTFNQALDAQNFPVLLHTVQSSGLFRVEPPLQQDEGIWILSRLDQAASRGVSEPPAPPPAVDAARTESLFARISGKQIGDGEGRIEMRPQGILIHPGENTPTRVRFRLGRTVNALTLAGFISALPEAAMLVTQAGTVSLQLQADGRLLDTVAIDRHSRYVKRLELRGVETLTVTVGNADGRAWWDWFILGVVGQE
jgi:hypothetical protein